MKSLLSVQELMDMFHIRYDKAVALYAARCDLQTLTAWDVYSQWYAAGCKFTRNW